MPTSQELLERTTPGRPPPALTYVLLQNQKKYFFFFIWCWYLFSVLHGARLQHFPYSILDGASEPSFYGSHRSIRPNLLERFEDCASFITMKPSNPIVNVSIPIRLSATSLARVVLLWLIVSHLVVKWCYSDSCGCHSSQFHDLQRCYHQQHFQVSICFPFLVQIKLIGVCA